MLYSNRAAAKSGSKDYQGALEDAEKVCLYVSFRASRSSCGWFEDKEESSTFNALAVAFGIALHSGSPRMGVAGPNTEHTDIQCIEIAPTFAKGFARKGAALHGLRSYPEAVMAYESGLQVDEADASPKSKPPWTLHPGPTTRSAPVVTWAWARFSTTRP